MLDEQLSWRVHHIAYVSSKIAQKTGIFSKLRHCMSLIQLQQLYYSLVHPYITYASLARGSGFKTQIKEVQTKHSNPIKCLKSGRKHLQHFNAKKISFPKTYNFLTEN